MSDQHCSNAIKRLMFGQFVDMGNSISHEWNRNALALGK